MQTEEFTIKQLQDMLKTKEAELEKLPNFPDIILVPDFSQLRKICEKYIQTISEGKDIGDLEHYIFECALETFYGKNIFQDWVNKKLK